MPKTAPSWMSLVAPLSLFLSFFLSLAWFGISLNFLRFLFWHQHFACLTSAGAIYCMFSSGLLYSVYLQVCVRVHKLRGCFETRCDGWYSSNQVLGAETNTWMGGSLTTVLCCHMWCKVFRMSSCHHISGALCSCTTWHFRVWLGQREAWVQTLQLKQIASQQNMVCGAVRWWNPHCPSREHFFSPAMIACLSSCLVF